MIAAGVLDNPRVEEIYGLHLTTQTPVGQVQVRPGPSMASADFFDVEVAGQGGHGAYPHLSIDPITAAANILLGMQNLVSREVAAQETAVLTVGQIVGGTQAQHHPGPRGHARLAAHVRRSRCATSSSSGSATSRPTSPAPTAPRRD